MGKNGRTVYINDISVMITDMDYGDYNDSVNGAHGKLNITFDVLVNDKLYLINFSNDPLDNENQHTLYAFKGGGDSYIQFLKEVETNPELRDKNQYSEDTENAANNTIGSIAQSIYYDVISHSPDQDEE